MGGGPKTPSVVSRTCKREPAGQNLCNEIIAAHVPRTVSPSLHPCPASGGASSFLLASALFFPPVGLATSRRTRRAMRPIDFCHPYDLRAPVPRAFPARFRSFRCVGASWSLSLRAAWPGDRVFSRHPRPLRRIVEDTVAWSPEVILAPRRATFSRRLSTWACWAHGALPRSNL